MRQWCTRFAVGESRYEAEPNLDAWKGLSRFALRQTKCAAVIPPMSLLTSLKSQTTSPRAAVIVFIAFATSSNSPKSRLIGKTDDSDR